MRFFLLIWKKWLRIARIIGNFQLRILFSLFYLLFFGPIGLIFRFFLDPLDVKQTSKKTSFVAWEYPSDTILLARKPF